MWLTEKIIRYTYVKATEDQTVDCDQLVNHE